MWGLFFAVPFFFFTNWQEYSGGQDVVSRLVEREKIQTVVVVGEKASSVVLGPGLIRVDVSLQRVYANSVRRGRVVPAFHAHSPFHYQFVYLPYYHDKLSYSAFCSLEENLFDVVKALNEDARPSRRLYVFSRACWCCDEALPSFMTKQEYEHMHRVVHVAPQNEEALPAFAEEVDVDVSSRENHL